VLVYYPRGAVRVADLREFRIDIGEDFEPAGTLQFRRGEEVLWSAEFVNPPKLWTIAAVPEEVVARVKAGDVLIWGYYPEEGEPVTEQLRVVEEPAGLREIDEKLAEQPEVLRRHFRAQVLRDHGLWTGAFFEAREVERLCGDRPSARALALQREALKALGLRHSKLAREAGIRFARVPDEERREVLAPRED
jgi:hypothetical protein